MLLLFPSKSVSRYKAFQSIEIKKHMSVDVKAEVVIERPRSEVAKLLFDPKSDVIWTGNINNSFPQTAGTLKKGSKVEHVGTFAGRAFSSVREVLFDEPEKRLDITGTEPFEMNIRYDLSDVPEGTLLKARIQSIGEILFQMPPAVLSKKVQEDITSDLKKLKKHLEEQEA
jgi:hypothetical protein